MSDTENIDRSKRPRREEDWDSENEGDNQDDRHPKRQAIPDPETKAPHFFPADEQQKPRNKGYTRTVTVASEEGMIAGNISLRSLVGMKDAGLIIGKGGKNVSEIRDSSMARVNISDIVPGAAERILTVVGPVSAVAKAYALVAEKIIEENTLAEDSKGPIQQDVTIKILILANRMGSIIGKSGSVIRSIQETSGAKVSAQEEPLPLSTERVVTIHGTPDAIEQAVKKIGDILVDQPNHHGNYMLYKPIAGAAPHTSSSNHGNGHRNYRRSNDNNNAASHAMPTAAAAAMMGYSGMLPMGNMSMNGFYYPPTNYPGGSGGRQGDYPLPMMPGLSNLSMMGGLSNMMPATQSQQIYIPNEMVGCIIGKGGMKINEIRQTSGSHIKIADPSTDSHERLITITGTPESHGPSKSTCLDCYGVSIKPDSSLVNIQLTGKFAYQGIVMLVKEKYTNKTVGEFKTFDEDLFTSVACDDDEEEQDWVEPDTTAVIGHVDAKLKNWPVNVGWNIDLIDKQTIDLKFQAMVVIDYENFHLLPETEFKLKRKVITTTEKKETAKPTEVEHKKEDVMVEQEHNELFIWTFLTLSIIYCSFSICLRQFINRQRKRKAIDSELQLVPTVSTKDN
ncbi:hypothetical protein G6F37_008062 [Rhizopus arrhizus]|nr:hypothetical protein G6F38_008121 [Rhizopus arrhizus]KAG1155953.1 hypothetical protein G6F37_008062 [Rhizopus arrhizus]